MSSCQQLGDSLREFAAGELDDAQHAMVESHLERCGLCFEELATIRLLLDSSLAQAPPGLEARIKLAVRNVTPFRTVEGSAPDVSVSKAPRPGSRRWVPVWATGAAAVVVLAVGTSIFIDRIEPDVGLSIDELAYLSDPIESHWMSDDGMIAGAPALESLSDEALEELLGELGG